MRSARARRPINALEFHVVSALQDSVIHTTDGSCDFYLERPVTAGRLNADWNYRLLLGEPGPGSQALMTICRELETTKGVHSRVINLYDYNRELIASLHWWGDAKKRMNGKESGTKKYLFDWQGRELVWDSKNTLTGIDHFCCDAGSGEVLCYFRSTFLPLQRDGKILISPKVKDDTTTTMLMASCIAYREWAAKRETGVYLK